MFGRPPTPDEALQIRRYEHFVPPSTLRVQNENPLNSAWMRAGNVLRNASHEDNGHGLYWLTWNGDRQRGWTFYCACGWGTPMRRTFTDGLDLMEGHWSAAAGKGTA